MSAYYSRKAEQAVESTLSSSIATSTVQNTVYRPVVLLLDVLNVIKVGSLLVVLVALIGIARRVRKGRV